MMPKGIFYADPRLANYLYFEMPLLKTRSVIALMPELINKTKIQVYEREE
jgi:hypothetical protein